MTMNQKYVTGNMFYISTHNSNLCDLTHSHPDIYTFTRHLADNQTVVYTKLNSLDEPPGPKCGKFKKTQEKLLHDKQMILLGRLPRKNFMVAASKRCAKQ